MSVLGTMMLRAGLLSESQVTAANEHAANQSLSHVDAILELGLADEDTLVAFLASKLMIPRVRMAVLERVAQPTIDRLSSALAWEHKCVPVSFDELGNLTIAMTDPTDLRAIAALAEKTGAYLVRAVGSASELRRALDRHYGIEQRAREQARASNSGSNLSSNLSSNGPDSESEHRTELALEPVRQQHAPPGIRNPAPQPAAPQAPYMASAAPYIASQPELRIPEDADDVPIRNGHAPAREVSGERPGPITDVQTGAPPPAAAALPQVDVDLHERPTVVETQAPIGPRGPRRPRAHTPWNPPLAGFAPAPVADAVPLSPDAFAEVLPRLDAATDRDVVTTLLLDFLGAGFNRVILFVHSHNELRGLDARGKDLLVEAVRQVRIPSGGKSMFSEVVERGTPYFGPIQSGSKIDQAFAQALGGIKGNVLLLPIKVASKVPLLLWAHGSNYPVDPRSITELGAAVSTAIQRIISAARKR